MLKLGTRFQWNEEEIAAKVVDGEAIMINLSNGIYYSLDKAGAVMWEQIAAGHSLGEVLAAVTQRYDVSAERAEADLRRLADELLQEQLVTVGDHERPVRDAVLADGGSGLPYQSPRLEVYRDIGHLIALDPPMPGLKDVPWKEPSPAS